MISEKSKKWVEAGKLLAVNPDAYISCPECELSNLEAKDSINENKPQEIERMIYCPKCYTKSFIKLSRKQ